MQRIAIDLSKLSTQFQRDTDSNRVETGVLQFNDDWPGVFIRGDNAFFYKLQLTSILKLAEQHPQSFDFVTIGSLKSLVDLLDSCVTVKEIEDIDDGVGC